MSTAAKILIVEDELIVATSIAQNLEKADYAVVCIASSANEALTAVEKSQPDLVLMDIRIKGMLDGVQVAQQIHQRFRIPIIFLTAHADRQTVERAKAVEPFGYLVKPVSQASLVTAIEIALYKHSIDRKLEEGVEALRRSNKDLEQFAYAAAHDLQEPLRNVALATQILAGRFQGQFDEDADSLLRTAAAAPIGMLAMVKDLLEYSRALHIEKGSIGTAHSDQVLSLALSNLQLAITETQAQISWESLPDVRMHEVHLLQLFQNLISNSLKYSGEKRPCVHVSSAQTGGSVRFFVKDNGRGISPESHDRAFGLFKRLHRENVPGTGIGLALCKRIVEHYGGSIWIESTGGEGTTLLFTVPVVAESKEGADFPSKKEIATLSPA